MPSVRSPSLRRHLAPRQKLWLNWDGVFLMGPRYLRFLDAVDRTGTIRAAGRAVGWSYRTCLNRIRQMRSEEHTSELQSQSNLVCRLLLEKKKERSAAITGSAAGAWSTYAG